MWFCLLSPGKSKSKCLLSENCWRRAFNLNGRHRQPIFLFPWTHVPLACKVWKMSSEHIISPNTVLFHFTATTKITQIYVVQRCFLLSPSKHGHQEPDPQHIDINGSLSTHLNGVCARPRRDTEGCMQFQDGSEKRSEELESCWTYLRCKKMVPGACLLSYQLS